MYIKSKSATNEDFLIQKGQIQNPDNTIGHKSWSDNSFSLFLPVEMNDEAISAEFASYLQNWKLSHYPIPLSNSMLFTQRVPNVCAYRDLQVEFF